MNVWHSPLVDEAYRGHEKTRYRSYLETLSDSISFEQNTWVCRNRRRSFSEDLHLVSIYFSKVPERYRDMVKYYALIRLISGRAIRTVNGEVRNVSEFLRFWGNGDLDSVNAYSAMLFKEYLDNQGYVESTCHSIWSAASSFLTAMNGYDDTPLKNPFFKNIYDSHEKLDYKYIPESVAVQLDNAFMSKDIPLYLRCIYWLLRLIPSRISEVLGMKIDCLKPFDGHFCLFIPTWKQNGGYREPVMRVIHINDDDSIGSYLLGLIREQQKTALAYQDNIPEEKKNALFTYRRELRCKSGIYFTDTYSVVSWSNVSYHFKEICGRFNIRDENGNQYDVTTHQFRHNGITERLAAGFTLEQIAEMTGHHGSAMIYNSYAHLDLLPETLRKPQNHKLGNENPYVLFGGRITNMDEAMQARLLSNIRSHRVRGGICCDITHCKSDMWECLSCKYFIPDGEQLDYFEEQAKSWRVKAERFTTDTIIRANALKNATLFETVSLKLKMQDGDHNE